MGIFDLFSGDAGRQAGADQIAAINQGKDEATAAFGQGRGALATDYAAALSPYTTNFASANRGQNAYADMMGLNGPEGNARALSGFQNNPGYNFQLGQGLDAARAAQAKSGMIGSGNAMMDLNNYAQGQANQGWQQYAGNLQPYLGAANNAAAGIAGVNTGLGNAINASYTGQGNLDYGADTSIGQAQAGADMANYNASKNLWGAGLALAGDAASAFGGGGGAAKKALFGGFGGG